MESLTRRRAILGGTSTLVAAVAGCLGDPVDDTWLIETSLPVEEATQYNDPGCSCCGEYARYLQDHLDVPLAIETAAGVTSVKRQFGIPSDLHSCHTVVLDGYILEGHIPVEIVDAMLRAQPAITGIALPGMPLGSPGMLGSKSETWSIYSFDSTGTIEVYTRL